MLNEKLKQGLSSYLLPVTIILSLSIVGVSSVIVTAVVNHMDVPTFINSLSTKKVTVDELQQGKLKNIILVDVRLPEEYAEDRIGQSLLVPLPEIKNGEGLAQIQALYQANLQSDRPHPTIVLYCTRGPRSVKAYKLLEKTGLNLVYLKGGIQAWREVVPAEKDAKILGAINRITLII